MKIVKGNLFDSTDHYILVTTNATIKKNGKLVMGAGAAKQAVNLLGDIDSFFGDLIKNSTNPKEYGVILGKRFGAFQVKKEFYESASISLISKSLQDLKDLSRMMPLKRFSVNFPGIGNGNLSYEVVKGLIDSYELSDNITFYLKPNNLIIAGGRDFKDYERLEKFVDEWIDRNGKPDNIISGMANGADLLGLHYAENKGIPVIKKPANWEEYGKSAGFQRNLEMSYIADSCICFWNGVSKGTSHMIDIAKKNKLNLEVILYDETNHPA